jgi:antitoxin YefM
MQETMHLLSTPANAWRLRDSVRQLDAGRGPERALVLP